MRAITVTRPGGPDVLQPADVPDPELGDGEVLLDVAATAVNRADLLQRQGRYPAPPGASDILGMECSGTVAAVAPGVTAWHVGDQVCALLAGGGYAERVAVPAVQVLPVPAGVDLVDAAALPEVACTVWSNLVQVARLAAGETLLVHGGASGIGTMAIQVGVALGATVAVTASRPAALDACRALGATVTVNYAEDDFVERIHQATEGRGADVVLDVVGARYLDRNVAALAEGGRLVIIGMQGGTRAELDIAALMAKRASVAGTTLRSRPVTGPRSKQEVVTAVREGLWPLVEQGRVRPVIDSVLPLDRAGDAHRRLEQGGHVGKVVVAVR
ncbi:NAD(P)H-quinone oxidoreductase [Nakamurella endophytica]|uniref:NAD(P)H quinone oxidoreductase n=1 Tax=Nakamurella endophytica TaxID=1748367 RepID=A0A917TB79_9ACTN|nr:NAD(P)H-quinone oxidoreductase [Nakamurella endophytica]GGM16374.1 NAD(P)H quinone oxidoreductase [Nakamurella endophytica]